jgi:hypothetical protein
MKTMDPRKVLALGALLIVTLTAGCAGGQRWFNSRDGVGGGVGFGNSYPNLDGSGGSYPHNNVYGSSIPDNSSYGQRKSG